MRKRLKELEHYLYKSLYIPYVPNYYNFLFKSIRDCESVLDLGCGDNSPLQYNSCGNPFSLGMDIFSPNLIESKAKIIHDYYTLADVENLCFKPKSFDCVMALDLIEHLDRDKGMLLIKKMESIAKKKIIIFTPNGFLRHDSDGGNVYNRHRSGWICRDIEKLGFSAFGFFGLKYLRGEYARLKYRPRLFWFMISELTQPIVYHLPNQASQILYLKKLQ